MGKPAMPDLSSYPESVFYFILQNIVFFSNGLKVEFSVQIQI